MRVLGIIPARYGSERFPGKPLADIQGKPMVQHVWERAQQCDALDHVIIATDDKRIREAAKAFGADVVMTSSEHRNGTERCYEALTKWDQLYDVVINIQGDEPRIHPDALKELIALFYDADCEIGTLARRVHAQDEIEKESMVTVVTDTFDVALYFSRAVIPFSTQADVARLKHIGIYGFRSDILRELTELEPTPLEQAENLEQLRWMENGYVLKVAETAFDTLSIDTPADLEKLIKQEKENG